MKVNYTVKKMTLKDSSKAHIEKKIEKLSKFFSDNADISIMLRLENNNIVTAELTIRDASTVFRAEDSQGDLVDAFDNAFDNIVRRIRKQKTKLEKRLKSVVFEPVPEYDEVETDEDDFKVVKVKTFSIKPLNVQEAILQMKMVGHKFYMFKNEQTGQTNVVYERNNGEYGLIEPE